jgi:hypothetical protein
MGRHKRLLSVVFPVRATMTAQKKNRNRRRSLMLLGCVLSLAVFLLCCAAGDNLIINAQSAGGGAGAAPLWGIFKKKIAVQKGVSVSAWEDRGDVSYEQYGTYAAEMTPVGDGTYEIKFELYPNTDYNFTFFAISTTPLQGITTGVVYYDAVPSYGSDKAMITSTSPVSPVVNNTLGAVYVSINGAARRKITIPDLSEGTTLYVYSNWASTPQAPSNFRARPGDSRVYLSWDAPYAWWGSGSEQYKAIDVIAGGSYVIYRSSVGAAGPYEVVATTPGYCFSWVDTSVQNGIRYYYAISSSDAYKGALDGDLGDISLVSSPSSPSAVAPGSPVPLRFRVEGIDMKVVKDKKYLVYLTPDMEGFTDETRRILFINSCKKIPARITEVKLPSGVAERFISGLKEFLGIKI